MFKRHLEGSLHFLTPAQPCGNHTLWFEGMQENVLTSRGIVFNFTDICTYVSKALMLGTCHGRAMEQVKIPTDW